MFNQIQIDTRWVVLFSVRCDHAYYLNKRGAELKFQPSPDTTLLLRNLQLVFRPVESGFEVYCPAGMEAPLARKLEQEGAKLCFYMISSNPHFLHFTELPLVADYGVYYFSNMTPFVLKDGTRLLHPGATASDCLRLPIRPKYFLLQTAKAVAPADIQILDDQGREKAWNATGLEKNTQFNLQLSHLPEGRYTIRIKGEKEIPLFLTSHLQTVLGVLEIHGQGAPETHHLIRKGVLQQPVFNIHFQNRQTHWRYFLIPNGKDRQELSEVAVSENGEKLAFTKPRLTQLSNGAAAYVIESEKPLPLLQKWSDSEKLEMKLRKGEKWISRAVRLEKPGIQMVKPDTSSKKIYSTVYVYL